MIPQFIPSQYIMSSKVQQESMEAIRHVLLNPHNLPITAANILTNTRTESREVRLCVFSYILLMEQAESLPIQTTKELAEQVESLTIGIKNIREINSESQVLSAIFIHDNTMEHIIKPFNFYHTTFFAHRDSSPTENSQVS